MLIDLLNENPYGEDNLLLYYLLRFGHLSIHPSRGHLRDQFCFKPCIDMNA